jgi:hypothetical protein
MAKKRLQYDALNVAHIHIQLVWFIGEDEGNDWVYVKLIVNHFNKWFIDLLIFDASRLFNPKHDLDNMPQILYIFFVLIY